MNPHTRRLGAWAVEVPTSQSTWVVADRDGTLVRECHYLTWPEQLELLPGVVEGLRLLARGEVPVVVVTNQSAVGRGRMDHAQLARVHQRLDQLLAVAGVGVQGIYYCPHRPDQHCPCRKPQPGLVLEAARDLGLDPRNAIVVGDKPCDVHLALRLGVPGLLVRTGYGTQWEKHLRHEAAQVVDDFAQAAQWILQHRSRKTLAA